MPVEIIKIIDEVETHDIKSFRLKFLNKEDEAKFNFLPGQFSELSIYGKGESPMGIA
jgi:NAD(P)H-flavin reductase